LGLCIVVAADDFRLRRRLRQLFSGRGGR
jgi:hypothetical protein